MHRRRKRFLHPGVDAARETARRILMMRSLFIEAYIRFLLKKEVSIFPKQLKFINHYLKQRKGE